MTKRLHTRVYRETGRNIAFLAGRLRAGEVVAVPTETVYGLAANALDSAACAKVFRAKGRPAADPLIVHIHSLEQLGTICTPNDAALRVAREFWPGPLTLILPKKSVIPQNVTAGRPSVGVRMPAHRVFRRLLKAVALPLAAPSANRFGYISPTTVPHVVDGLGGRIKYVLDGGPSRLGIESTILDLRDPSHPAILRPGFIAAAAIQKVLGRRVRRGGPVRSDPGTETARGLLAPGQLLRHYSPHTRLILHRRLRLPPAPPPPEAYLLMGKPAGARYPNVFWLDARRNLRGAARRLFAMLRKLDAMKFARIHVELARGGPLAETINDRLRRAAAR